MSKSIQQMLSKAFKAITVPDLGDARLVPEQADRFVRIVQERSVIIGDSRQLTMTADRRNIDRTGFSGRILQAPQNEGETFESRTSPDFFTNELVAQKVRGAARLSDETLEENIERGNFEDTLVEMIADQAALDLEDLLVNGGTDDQDAFLELTDGWFVKAEQQLDGQDTPADFDPEDVEDLFDAMILSVDPKYLRDRARWRLYVTFEMEDHYRNVLRARGTGLGDAAQTGSAPLSYKGFRVQELPKLPAGHALFSSIDNLVHGMRREIEIEPERVAGDDAWDFHVRAKADCHYEDENAAAAAEGYTGPTE